MPYELTNSETEFRQRMRKLVEERIAPVLKKGRKQRNFLGTCWNCCVKKVSSTCLSHGNLEGRKPVC